MTTLDDLLDDIFGGRQPALRREFRGWALESRRFKAFATSHSSKIRAKLRNARDDGGVRDLRAELETAALLLRDDRFTLEYEKYTASKQRGPDFTVTFRTHTLFNVEVRRLRQIEMEEEDSDARIAKLMSAVCDKAGQMPPSIPNLLWLVADREVAEDDVARAAVTLRHLAERKNEDYFTRRGFESAADFLKQYQRLSGIMLRQPGHSVLWLNPLARHKAPPEIAAAIQRLDSR